MPSLYGWLEPMCEMGILVLRSSLSLFTPAPMRACAYGVEAASFELFVRNEIREHERTRATPPLSALTSPEPYVFFLSFCCLHGWHDCTTYSTNVPLAQKWVLDDGTFRHVMQRELYANGAPVAVAITVSLLGILLMRLVASPARALFCVHACSLSFSFCIFG